MESMYRNEMESYGKNNWNVFANGVSRWVGKMEREFQRKVDKCGQNYYTNDRKRRAVPPSRPGGKPVQMNEWCDRFNGHVNALVNWTETYMVECCFMVTDAKENSLKECTKGGDKYVKKWKKMMGKFFQGARNQPSGAKCSQSWAHQ